MTTQQFSWPFLAMSSRQADTRLLVEVDEALMSQWRESGHSHAANIVEALLRRELDLTAWIEENGCTPCTRGVLGGLGRDA